jgi:hypothetical protein
MERRVVWTVSVVVSAALLSACSLLGPTREELRDGAFSLVPSHSTIVNVVEGDCVELAPSPSCVHIYFVRIGSLQARTAEVEQAARDGQWTRTLRDVLPGGNQLGFRRGRLRASVFLWPSKRAAPCRNDPKPRCADVVMVEGAS